MLTPRGRNAPQLRRLKIRYASPIAEISNGSDWWLPRQACGLKEEKPHSVPRHYLKRFSFDQGSQIRLFNLDNGKYVPKAPLKSQCSSSYFYGEDSRGENILAEIEGIAEDLFSQICKDRDIPKSYGQRLDLMTVLSLMHRRTRRQAELDSDFIEVLTKRSYRIQHHIPALSCLWLAETLQGAFEAFVLPKTPARRQRRRRELPAVQARVPSMLPPLPLFFPASLSRNTSASACGRPTSAAILARTSCRPTSRPSVK